MRFASASPASERWRIRWWRCRSSKHQAPEKLQFPSPKRPDGPISPCAQLVIGTLRFFGAWTLGIWSFSYGFPFDSRFRRWQGVGSIWREIGRFEAVRFPALGEYCRKTMADLAGNLLVAQSGGPTAVINASVAGI